jgi:hypothetical protein
MALCVHDSLPTELYYPDETKSTKKEMEELIMLDILERNWWTFAVRGVVAVIFGLLALIWPAQTLVILVLLFGAYAFLDGVFAIVTGIASIRLRRWWAVLLEGIAGVAITCRLFRPWSPPRPVFHCAWASSRAFLRSWRPLSSAV